MWFLQILQIYSIGEKTIRTIECNKVLLLQLISLPVSKFMPQMILSIPTSWFPHNLIPATDLLSLPPGEASVLQTESTDLFIKSGRLQLSVLKRFASRNRDILNIFRCSFQSGVCCWLGLYLYGYKGERRRHEDSEWEDAECRAKHHNGFLMETLLAPPNELHILKLINKIMSKCENWRKQTYSRFRIGRTALFSFSRLFLSKNMFTKQITSSLNKPNRGRKIKSRP